MPLNQAETRPRHSAPLHRFDENPVELAHAERAEERPPAAMEPLHEVVNAALLFVGKIELGQHGRHRDGGTLGRVGDLVHGSLLSISKASAILAPQKEQAQISVPQREQAKY